MGFLNTMLVWIGYLALSSIKEEVLRQPNLIKLSISQKKVKISIHYIYN